MLKPNRQSLLVAMAICSGAAQPAFSENIPAASSGQKPVAANQTQSPLPQTNNQPQAQNQATQFSPEAVGTAPTLGEVLGREAQQQAQSAPTGYANGARAYAPGTPGLGQNAPLNPQGSPGYAPNGYPQTAYPGGGIRSGVGNILNEVRGMVQNMVQVNPGSENVRVRVPFVNVDVNHGQPNVKVNAPFVKVDKTPDAPVSVNAPFVNVTSPNP